MNAFIFDGCGPSWKIGGGGCVVDAVSLALVCEFGLFNSFESSPALYFAFLNAAIEDIAVLDVAFFNPGSQVRWNLCQVLVQLIVLIHINPGSRLDTIE